MSYAQITIVDAENNEPLPGVYVYSADGKLITISDGNGQVNGLSGTVMLSIMSYESLTLNADKISGNVKLTPKPYALSEVVIGKTEFLKFSATFRDIRTNFNRVVMYREGIVDFYYDKNNDTFKRRIRACRQYEHKDYRNFKNDSIVSEYDAMFDLRKVHTIQTDTNRIVKGDTTYVGAIKGKTLVNDGVMMIKRDGCYRIIIDSYKLQEKTTMGFLGMHKELKKNFVDWQYNDPKCRKTNLQAARMYMEEDLQWSKNKPIIPVSYQSELVINSITNISKEEMKNEMKDKEIKKDFELPDCLPSIPESLILQIKNLELRKFKEF